MLRMELRHQVLSDGEPLATARLNLGNGFLGCGVPCLPGGAVVGSLGL